VAKRTTSSAIGFIAASHTEGRGMRIEDIFAESLAWITSVLVNE
jgi:hypothetical protein